MNLSPVFNIRLSKVSLTDVSTRDRITRVWLNCNWFDCCNVYETLYKHLIDSTASESRCPIKDCRLFFLSSLSTPAYFVFHSLIKVSESSQQQMCGAELCIAAKAYILVMPLFYKKNPIRASYWQRLYSPGPLLSPVTQPQTFKAPPLLSEIKLYPMLAVVTAQCSPSWELELRPLGVATGNASAWLVSEDTYLKTPPVGRRQPMTSLPACHNISAAGRLHHQLFRLHWLVCLKKRAFW